MIRPVCTEDATVLSDIYNHYIEHTTITFEETPVSPEEMSRRVADVTAVYPWLVWEEAGTALGYAYGRAFHQRSAYRKTVESAVYLHHEARGRGIGWQLYNGLLEILDAQGYHVILGALALPNEASAMLHEKCGFTKVGHFAEVGFKFGKWIDVGYWQRTSLLGQERLDVSHTGD